MKLYVWEQPYPVLYGSSIIYAVASSLDDARDEARRSFEATEHVARMPQLGEPTRVRDFPCAGWHEWSE